MSAFDKKINNYTEARYVDRTFNLLAVLVHFYITIDWTLAVEEVRAHVQDIVHLCQGFSAY